MLANVIQIIVEQAACRYGGSMIADLEIWACANHLMEHHGAHALAVATRRAHTLLAEGKLEGHRTFVLIADRIRQFEQAASSDSLN